MGESSVVMVKMPSNFRSGKGSDTSAEMRAITLVCKILVVRHMELKCNELIPCPA